MTVAHHSHDADIAYATTGELGQMAALKLEIEKRTYTHPGADWRSIGTQWCSVDYLNRLRAQGQLWRARNARGEICGLIALQPAQPFAGFEAATLSALYVGSPGQGIGTALLTTAAKAAAFGSATVLLLEVLDVNIAAARWVENRGFTQTGRRRPSASFPGAVLHEYAAACVGGKIAPLAMTH